MAANLDSPRRTRGSVGVNGIGLIDWSTYRLQTTVVVREVATLEPFKLSSLEMPPLAPEDFALLLESVQANGVYEPLTITPAGQVIDGHARLSAARKAGLHDVPTRILESGGESEYATWAAIVNIGRRHLTTGQRFRLVKALLVVLREQAQERQAATRFGGRDRSCGDPVPVRPNLDPPVGTADVRARVGALLGVSRSQAAKMVDLAKHGSPALQEAVQSGRKSIHRAHTALRAHAAPRRGLAESRTLELSTRHALESDPIEALRIVAALIPKWLEGSSSWPGSKRNGFIQGLQSVADSCELAFRRLLTPG